MNRLLIALDLDGTLLNNDSVVSTDNADALAKAHGQGHEIMVVTGRSWRTAIGRLTDLPFIRHVVCSNGAYEIILNHSSALPVENAEQVDISWARMISASQLQIWYQRIANQLPVAPNYAWETVDGFGREPEFDLLRGDMTVNVPHVKLSDLGDVPVYKLFVACKAIDAVELQQVIRDLLGDTADITNSGAPFVEITAPGVNKGSGLAAAAKKLDFTADQTLVFGDNYNDVSMFEWAGQSVAMGNAVTLVKQIASHTTLTNDAHGVATYLNRHLLQ